MVSMVIQNVVYRKSVGNYCNLDSEGNFGQKDKVMFYWSSSDRKVPAIDI